MLVRDKRTTKKIIIDGGIKKEINRYRLFAVNTPEHPDSVQRCMEYYYGLTSVYPMDIFLGIDNLPYKMTAEVALKVAKYGASSSSYEEAANQLKTECNIPIESDNVRQITNYIGRIVLHHDRKELHSLVDSYDPREVKCTRRGRPPKDGFILYGKPEGVMFNSRQKEGTDSNWKENRLGVVFRSDDLIGCTDGDGRVTYSINKREYVATTEGIEEFRVRFLGTLIKNGIAEAKNVVILGDSADWVTEFVDHYLKVGQQILDLDHLKENVLEFARFIFNGKEKEYTPWWESVCNDLEEGKWREVLRRDEIAAYNPDRKDCKTTPGDVVNLYEYIRDHRKHIDYPNYLEKFIFIGNEGIESKSVAEARLTFTGMRWIAENAETTIVLCTKLKSGLWDEEVAPLVLEEYNKFHLKE